MGRKRRERHAREALEAAASRDDLRPDMIPSPRPAGPLATLPAPMRRLAGFALLAAGVGFTGLLSFIHVLVELFD